MKKREKRKKAKKISKRKKKIKKIHLKRKKHSSKIKKKKIIKAPPKRISTGIQNLDRFTEGGFEYNSTNTLVGGAGSGKSIFATQFLVEGMKKGEKCLYVTFEEKKKRFYKNMLEFGWNLEEYEKKGLFTFLEYTPIKVKTMLEEGGGTIESTVLTEKITRMVIDSMTSFALLFEDELERREAALALFNMIRKWSCTSLLTLEEDPLADQKTTSKPLEFESDSIILLYFIREKGQRKRFLEILKMRGTEHSKNIHRFHIKEKKGIVVERRPYKNFRINSR